jgi:hypothetical protein
MQTSHRLALPYLAAAQAQKHVTHNEALERLDVLVQTSVKAHGLNVPPTSPANGSLYAIGPAPSGAWAGKAGRLAQWQTNFWQFFDVPTGLQAWSEQTNLRVTFNGTSWEPAQDGLGQLKIEGGASAQNALNVTAASSLFTNDSGGHQVKINKQSVSQTASVLMQSGFSGRAEIGLTGDDKLHVKVSADGTNWREGLVIDPAGRIGLNTAQPGNAIEVVGVNGGQIADITTTNYGTGNGGVFHGQYAAGTPAAPLPPSAVTLIAGFGGRAWHAGGAFQPHSASAIHCMAMESPTATAWGAGMNFLSTPIGSSARRVAASLTPDGTWWSVDASTWNMASPAQTKPAPDVQVLASASAQSGALSCSMAVTGYGLVSVGFRGFSARGTVASPTASLSGDMLSFLGGHGHDGTSFGQGSKALIAFRTEENWTTTAQGSNISFDTTPIGSTARVERMRIAASGNVGIGTTAPSTKLHVAGPVRLGSYTVATVPSASGSGAGSMIFVSNESGGAVIAFSDGTAWRRVTDRLVIS